MMHIGVGIGVTFTDCVAVDRDGRRSIAKGRGPDDGHTAVEAPAVTDTWRQLAPMRKHRRTGRGFPRRSAERWDQLRRYRAAALGPLPHRTCPRHQKECCCVALEPHAP
jgi:hypothetical protein